MQKKALAAALLALAAGASAQTSISPDVQSSVLLVLATAIPSASVSYAIASPSAFADEVAASLAAGNTPAWYQALPTDVLSILPLIYPAQTQATPTPSAAYSSSAAASSLSSSATYAVSSAASISPVVPTANSTSGAVQTPTLTASASASAATFTGAAASLPTAAIGASIGAVLGFLGMLAL